MSIPSLHSATPTGSARTRRGITIGLVVTALGASSAIAAVPATAAPVVAAPAPAVAGTAPTAAVATQTITVKRGQTVSGIAKKYRTTVKWIAAKNKLKNVNLIRVGQRLIVPAAKTTSTPTPKSPAPKQNFPRVAVGKTVKGKTIYAHQIGDPKSKNIVVVLGSMHGEEQAGTRTVNAMLAGKKVKGVQMWVIPTINPDGASRGVRYNAHGVDLNANWGDNWYLRSKSAYSYGGPKVWSEPEVRAVRDFLNKKNPKYVLSLHQPLFGVDTYKVKSTALQKALVKNLKIPSRYLDCHGVCRGTMTGWFNKNHKGAAITVEYGLTPSKTYVTKTAPPAIVKSLGGSY